MREAPSRPVGLPGWSSKSINTPQILKKFEALLKVSVRKHGNRGGGLIEGEIFSTLSGAL